MKEDTASKTILARYRRRRENPKRDECKRLLEKFELAFNLIFLVELLMNMHAHWFLPFWTNSWNVIDFIVVIVSLVAMVGSGNSGFTVLRLFRAFRVFRLFKRIPSLRKIIVGIISAV